VIAALAWPELPVSPNPPTSCDNESIPWARGELGNIMKSRRKNAVALTNIMDRVLLIFFKTNELTSPKRKTKRTCGGLQEIEDNQK
jgi:hypothetical protein